MLGSERSRDYTVVGSFIAFYEYEYRYHYKTETGDHFIKKKRSKFDQLNVTVFFGK